MKILFIVPSYKPAYIYGGPIVVIARLAEHLVKLGHNVTVYTTTANGKEELELDPNISTLVDGVEVYYFKRQTKDHTHVSTALWKVLNKHVKEFDLVHIHSWWNPLVIGAALICKMHGVKPVLSPHGMLSTYILNTNNSFLKSFLHRVIGKRLLQNTSLHVSTELEWKESQHIINGWNGVIIPNLVHLSSIKYTAPLNTIFTIGFISRIDPKKGLDVLIKALATVSFPYKLLIAGDGDEKYTKSLKMLAQDEGIEHHIEWVGWKNGEDKFDFVSSLDLFALTSHSENFAIVVIEALSVGTPVLISDQVGLHTYISERNLGWVTDMRIEHIADALTKLQKEHLMMDRIRLEAPTIIYKEYNDTYLTNKYLAFYKQLNKDRV